MKKEYALFYYTFLEKARCTVRMTNSNSELKKGKSVPGFEPGLHGQNAITLPLAPLPLPSSYTLITLMMYLSLVKMSRSHKSHHLADTAAFLKAGSHQSKKNLNLWSIIEYF